MKGSKLLAAFAVVLCAIVIVGEMYAYLPNDYGYGSSAEYSDGSIDYTVENHGSDEFDAILLDNGGYTAIDTVYVYYDPDYVSAVNEDVPVEVGAQKMTQEYYIDQVVRVLEYRGCKNIIMVDADQLADVLAGDLANVCVGKGLVMASGAIPDTVFSGSESDIIVRWVEAGGSLYWVGNVIGKYVSTQDGLVTVDASALFVGTDAINLDNSSAYEDASDLRAMFSYEYNRTMYSVDISKTDRQCLVAGYTDGTYASTTFVQMGSGQVCIVAGEFNSKQVRDLAISVCSGLCYCSQVIVYDQGIVDNKAWGSMSVPADSGNLRLYLYIGGYFCVYGQGYNFQAEAVANQQH